MIVVLTGQSLPRTQTIYQLIIEEDWFFRGFHAYPRDLQTVLVTHFRNLRMWIESKNKILSTIPVLPPSVCFACIASRRSLNLTKQSLKYSALQSGNINSLVDWWLVEFKRYIWTNVIILFDGTRPVKYHSGKPRLALQKLPAKIILKSFRKMVN